MRRLGQFEGFLRMTRSATMYYEALELVKWRYTQCSEQ